MMNLPIMPDLPTEYIRYLNDNENHIILDERIFIKKLFAGEYNIDVLQQLNSLKIPNYNAPSKLFIDESNTYLYVASKYLKGYQNLFSYLKNCSTKEKLLLYKKLLTSLKEAHENDFIPYDIAFRNYLVSEDKQPIFIDFDISLYKNKSTWLMLKRTLFSLKEFSKDSYDLSKENLVLNDKMLVLNMLLTSLCPPTYYIMTLSLREIMFQYKVLLSKYELDPGIKEYLSDIILGKMAPHQDDYFIENLIDPLMEKEPVLKKL